MKDSSEEQLRQTIRLSLTDLAPADGLVIRFDEYIDTAHPTIMLCGRSGSRVGIWLDNDLPPGEALAHIAEQVQEMMVEELWAAGRSTNFPVCPEHPDSHPLKATMLGDNPWWVCPVTSNAVTRIGDLAR